jgi:peroxiredoxin (alkyl hydroperoxide reductase subunit C)
MSSLLIGKKAPAFRAKAVINKKIVEGFSLEKFLGKYVVFFFYPLDFTFVCPTELHAFQEQLAAFNQLDAEVIGCSVDSCYTHLAWSKQPQSKGGIEGVEYPLVSDLSKEIAKNYQVLKEEEGIAYRAQFLIDKQGIIRHQLVNDLPLGRSVPEVLRLLEALIFHEKHGEVCPANWKVGAKAMQPTADGLQQYFTQKAAGTQVPAAG